MFFSCPILILNVHFCVFILYIIVVFSLLQQLGVIKLAAPTPIEQNIQFLQLMAKIFNKDIPVDTLLVWEDLYQVIDSVYYDLYKTIC